MQNHPVLIKIRPVKECETDDGWRKVDDEIDEELERASHTQDKDVTYQRWKPNEIFSKHEVRRSIVLVVSVVLPPFVFPANLVTRA